MAPTYWLDVFTPETWDEFRQHGATVSGFPAMRRNTVNRMQEGDILLCYLKGVKRWVGYLEVVGSAYDDDSRIWSADTYPARIPVKAVVALDPEYGVPITDMQAELSIFDANGGGWGVQLQGSPKIWHEADGVAVVRALREADDNRVHRPVLGARRRPKPPVEEPEPLPVEPLSEGHGAPFPEGNGEEVTIPDEGITDEGASNREIRKHTEIQFKLVQLGSDMGFDTHVARNDRNITWSGRKLADVDGIIEDLQLPFDRKINETIDLIDVLWLDGSQIVAAFEVESTTSIYSGLLRMSDLLAMNPNMEIRLYLVAPETRREKVKEQVNRPTFAKLRKPLVKVCRYVAFERLIAELDEHKRVIRHMKIDWLEDDISESCAKRE